MNLKSIKALSASFLLLGMSFSPETISGAFAQNAKSSTQQSSPQQEKIDPSLVIAIIDGKSITAGMLDEWSKILINPGQNLTNEQRRLQTLSAIINFQAFANAARKEKLDETAEFKERMNFMRDSVLQQLYIDQKAITQISDDELKARYDKEIAAFPNEVEMRARHILVKTKAEAEDLIKKLAKGADFEKLAKEKSTDGTASSGGDLGYFSKGQMVKPFDEAAFALKAGQYTKTPVETPFGWHIIKVEDLRKKQPPTFEATKSYIQNMIVAQRYDDLRKNVINSLKISYPDKAVSESMEKILSGTENAEQEGDS